MALDFKIDNEKLIPQPSRLRAHPPKSRPERHWDGGWQSTVNELGWTFDITFGSGQLAMPEMVAALQAARNGTDLHTITYNDSGGTERTHDVIWPEEVMHYIRWGGLSESFTIQMYERSA